MSEPIITYHPEVQAALQDHRPVVALESTLITHGFSQPDNILVARAIEEAVRASGAVPATIAVLNGRITVGLSADQLDYLGTTRQVRKCSVRDLPLVLARRENGSTTVAATMVIAHRAGIAVFATGGIGGVHRDSNWDISADLRELGRTPITVICAGMKAFLDLPATLEYLETQAVPVLGYRTSELPAFYSRSSGLQLDLQVNNPTEAAEIIQARDALELQNAILLTIPVPEADEWPAAEANVVIEQALAEVAAKQITGKAISPYLLSRIASLSEGRSKRANQSLIFNNARLGAAVAASLSQELKPAVAI